MVRPGDCQCTRRPQGLPPVGVEAAEGPCRCQRLHDRAARIDAALKVFDRLVGSTCGDGLGQVHADGPNRTDPHPQCQTRPTGIRGDPLQGRKYPGPVQVRGTDLNPVSTGVLDQRVRRIEAHGLGVQEASAEGRRVMVLQPATGVDEMGERHGVALRESEVGKGRQLQPNPLGHVGRDPPATRPVQEMLTEGLHSVVASFGAHGLTQVIGLSSCEPGHVDGQLHELLLEQRDTQRLG